MVEMSAYSQVRIRREHVLREIERLKVELGELDVAERVLARLNLAQASVVGAPSPTTSKVVALPSVPIDPAQRSKGTIEELIRTFLLEHKTGWATANEIRDWLAWKTNRDVPMSSVSPTLSNMKHKSIVRDGLKVAAIERASIDGQKVIKEDGEIVEASDVSDVDDNSSASASQA